MEYHSPIGQQNEMYIIPHKWSSTRRKRLSLLIIGCCSALPGVTEWRPFVRICLESSINFAGESHSINFQGKAAFAVAKSFVEGLLRVHFVCVCAPSLN
jgi:hypothetical protein